MNTNGRSTEAWGTRIGVILAVAGSAVGLGNFLRFPGLAAQYEGGAFMIPYFIALVLIGFPLAWGEWAMGRYGGTRGYNSSPGIYRAIWKNRFAPYFGVLGMLVPVIIYMYYVLIESWCLAYAWYYLNGTMAEIGRAAVNPETGVIDQTSYANAFTSYTGGQADGSAFSNAGLIFLAICFVLNFTLIYRGLSKGIERFCLVAMPALIVCAILILIRVLTLPVHEDRTVAQGLGFMWNPRLGDGFWVSLANPKMWIDAVGQIFFSLSVGFGIIITYSSYMKPNDDIALSSLSSAAGNEFCEVALGGMIIIPASFIFLGAAAVTAAAGSSFTLGFITLPMVFEQMPMGHFVGFLFFFLLFLAAVTSSLSMLQPAIALLEEAFSINRSASVSILGFVTLCGALFVLYFSQGTKALATFDNWVGTLCIFILALFQTLLFGWVLGPKKGLEELRRGAEIPIPSIIGFMLKYLAPLFLTAVFIAFLYGQINMDMDGDTTTTSMFVQVWLDPVVAMSIGFIFIVALFFLLVIHQGVKRWEKAEALAEQNHQGGDA